MSSWREKRDKDVNFPNSRSDKCTSLLGWTTLENITDMCKLLFFDRLCRLQPSALPKRIMITRLVEYKHFCVSERLGFIPDIYRIALKYGLANYIVDFANSSTFWSKRQWSSIVNIHINNTEQTLWYARVSSDPDFSMFIKTHSTIIPHRAWTVLKQFPELRDNVKYVIDICCMMRLEPYQLLRDKCGTFFSQPDWTFTTVMWLHHRRKRRFIEGYHQYQPNPV